MSEWNDDLAAWRGLSLLQKAMYTAVLFSTCWMLWALSWVIAALWRG